MRNVIQLPRYMREKTVFKALV